MPSPSDSCQETCADGKSCKCGSDCKCGDNCKCNENSGGNCGCTSTENSENVEKK